MPVHADLFAKMESEVRSYCRDYPCLFAKARGSELITVDGVRYIDFLAGAGSLNYGHNHPVIKQQVCDYLMEDGIVHSLDMHTAAKARFLEALDRHILKPRDLVYKAQFTGPTGTNAVEAAMKLARQVTGRQTIISFTGGFHGVTLGAVAATANDHHRSGASVALSGATFMPYDGYMADVDSLAYLERMLSDPSSGLDHPAAILVETVQGEGGVNVASPAWLQGLQRLCREHDMLLIVDDIQMGNGRTGSFFSFEEAGIKPDLITLSKSLGGIGLPVALLLMRPELDIWQPGAHNGTFRGNSLAFIAATAAIEHFWTDDCFATEVRRKGQIVRQYFQWLKADNPTLHAKVRGRGMVWGLELPDEGVAAAVVGAAFERRLIIENCGSEGKVIKFLAPLTTPDDVLESGLQRLAESVAVVAGKADQVVAR